jgi:hypothetical protein
MQSLSIVPYLEQNLEILATRPFPLPLELVLKPERSPLFMCERELD